MTVARLQVFYQRGEGDKWSNVYHADGAPLGDVHLAAQSNMISPLLELLSPSCRIVKLLTSSLTDDTFFEASIEQAGVSGLTDSLLPFFNCAKVLIQTASTGRPDVKFLKGFLTEAATDSGQIESTPLSDIASQFAAMISGMSADSTPLCGDDGGVWTTVSVQPTIQMRQMHRRRRRTPAP